MSQFMAEARELFEKMDGETFLNVLPSIIGDKEKIFLWKHAFRQKAGYSVLLKPEDEDKLSRFVVLAEQMQKADLFDMMKKSNRLRAMEAEYGQIRAHLLSLMVKR